MKKRYDFGGYATRHDVPCSDGRTIRKDAFADCDGIEVPIVYQHNHSNMGAVLGHGLLENREDGVYIYGSFNDTNEGRRAKTLVDHGDISRLSIFANNLKEHCGNVMHGVIREVSLVLAGANPEAYIDAIGIEHGADGGMSADIYNWPDEIETNIEVEENYVKHTDGGTNKMDENKLEAILNTMTPEQLAAVDALLGSDDEEESEELSHAEEGTTDKPSEKTVGDVLKTFTEEQMNVLNYLMAKAAEEALSGKGGEAKHSDIEGEDDMKTNIFDNGSKSLSHAEEYLSNEANVKTIMSDAERYGQLSKSFLAHAAEYGVDNIEWLMPEFQNVNGNGAPGFIKTKPDAWIDVVMNGVHHTPFAKVKMMFADIREDDARAKGYMKGKYKKEEVFGLLKRQVGPQTVYKKQRFDRDDIIDVTSFDIVAWIKGEMRMQLDAELARAFVFGDGRSVASEDKIREQNIIPIYNDEDLYCIKKTVTPASGEALGHAIINAAVKAQDEYEGSGNLTAFLVNSTVSDMLLMEDKDGHRLYNNINDVANAMAVEKIVKVPASVMPNKVYAVIVDLSDYNVGADKGGAIRMFDDFDIDFNQEKYLIETRCSGALIKPYSAITLKAAD